MAVAEDPSFGMRINKMVSVLVATSSAECSWASSFSDSGLPWASVRESVPTMRMSTAPSLPLPRLRPPSLVMLFSRSVIWFHAYPVAISTSTDTPAAMMRVSGRPECAGVGEVGAGSRGGRPPASARDLGDRPG